MIGLGLDFPFNFLTNFLFTLFFPRLTLKLLANFRLVMGKSSQPCLEVIEGKGDYGVQPLAIQSKNRNRKGIAFWYLALFLPCVTIGGFLGQSLLLELLLLLLHPLHGGIIGLENSQQNTPCTPPPTHTHKTTTTKKTVHMTNESIHNTPALVAVAVAAARRPPAVGVLFPPAAVVSPAPVRRALFVFPSPGAPGRAV